MDAVARGVAGIAARVRGGVVHRQQHRAKAADEAQDPRRQRTFLFLHDEQARPKPVQRQAD